MSEDNFVEMIAKTYYPEHPLDDLYRECYYLQMDDIVGIGRIPVIDDCCYDIVFFKEAEGNFYYGEDVRKVHINSKVFTINSVTPPYRIEAKNSLTFFTIKLQPWVNAYFFSELEQSGVVDIGKLDSSLERIHQKLFSEVEVSARFDIAEELMMGKIFELSPSMELVREICALIYERQGKITVNELSEHFEKSRQYLGKIFKKEVMYPLKKFIITVRILDLVKYKAKNPDVLLTQLSYDYGYFDQAHFINDFKKVCGVKPLEFFNNLPEFLLRHQ